MRNISDVGAEIRSSWTFKAWGWDPALTFERTGMNQTFITVVSTPVVRSTAVDWGQGASDLRSVSEAIDNQTNSVTKE